MKTQLPATPKTKKVWQKPMLTVMSSTEQIQGGGNRPDNHEAGHVNGKFYTAPNGNPAAKSIVTMAYFNHYHS